MIVNDVAFGNWYGFTIGKWLSSDGLLWFQIIDCFEADRIFHIIKSVWVEQFSNRMVSGVKKSLFGTEGEILNSLDLGEFALDRVHWLSGCETEPLSPDQIGFRGFFLNVPPPTFFNYFLHEKVIVASLHVCVEAVIFILHLKAIRTVDYWLKFASDLLV